MQFRVLGPVEVAVGGSTLALSSRRRRRLLAALVARAGEVAPPEQLVDAVWGTDPPASARESLHSHVSRLRGRLRELDADHERIVTRGGGYGLVAVDGDEVDAIAFEREVQQARRVVDDDPARARDLVEQALARWRGAPYADARQAAEDEARRLEAVHRTAHQVRTDALVALGDLETALVDLEGRLGQDPLDERTVGQLMLVQSRSGRQADAITTFHAFRRRLAEELGVDPSPSLLRRYEALVRQDEDVMAPSPPARARPGTTRTGPAGDEHGRGRLAASPTSFVGREAAATTVAGLVTAERLVTLTGPGGVGKTRLATAVVDQVSGSFTDVVPVALAPVRERSSLEAVVASACGVVGGDVPVRDRLVDALRGRRLLLVLDNCEHLLPELGELVEHLVRSCDRLTVLATSRERLAVPGERRWPVAPLPLPVANDPVTPDTAADSPAVRLFCDRAVAADPTFELTADNAQVVTEICRRLDGLPLALELAAARAVAFSMQELAQRLDQRFALLTTGPSREGGRHRTLSDVVAWSYELLEEPAGELFDLLSVFAGGFTLDAAEAVAERVSGHRRDVAATLASLVDSSMVTRTGDRYTMLESLRLYGAERLAEREQVDATRRAHAQHLAVFVERAGDGMRGPDDDVWVPRLEAELANVRAAFQWAVAAGEPDLALRLSAPLGIYADGWLVDEITEWAAEASHLPGTAGHPLLPEALGTAARGALNRGQLDRAVQLARQGLAAAGEDDPGRILPLKALSLAAVYEGRLDASAERESEVLALAEAAGDHHHVAHAWIVRALIAAYGDDMDTARSAGDHAARLADSLGNTCLRGLAAYARGEVLARDDPQAALPLLDEAVRIGREIGARLLEATALVTRSTVRVEGGDPDAALDSLREAIDRLRRGGDWTHQWTTLRNLVFLLARIGAPEPAATLLGTMSTTDTAASPYGRDATRLEAVTAELQARLGPEAFERAHACGRRMDDTEAVTSALATIDHLRGAASRT